MKRSKFRKKEHPREHIECHTIKISLNSLGTNNFRDFEIAFSNCITTFESCQNMEYLCLISNWIHNPMGTICIRVCNFVCNFSKGGLQNLDFVV